MVKRKKWDDKEDEALMKVLGQFSLPYKWDVVSHQMKKKGYKKSSKQCRERWMHQLDPNLKKEKWSKEEDHKIFELHQKIGNHWKKISEHFPGRTDNQVKNNFFSLIRKSLRVACKIIGKVSNTKLINDIKPKVLSTFITKKLTVDIPAEISKDKKKHTRSVNLNEFIYKFSQNKFAEIYTTITAQDKHTIEQCVNYLMQLNDNYSDSTSRVKKIHKKNKKQFISKEILSKNSDQSKIKKNVSQSSITEKRNSQDKKALVRSWTKINNDCLWDYFKDLQNCVNNSKMLKFNVVTDNVECKLKLIDYVNILLDKVKDLQKKLAYANSQEIDDFVIQYSNSTQKQKKEPETILSMLGDNKFFKDNFQNSMLKVQKQYLDSQSQQQVFRKVSQSKLSLDSFNNIGKQSENLFQEGFGSYAPNDQLSNLLDSKKRSGIMDNLFPQYTNDSEYQRLKDDEKIANQRFQDVFNDKTSNKDSATQNQEFQFKNFNPAQINFK